MLAIACVWFLTLGVRHLIPSDEGRYAEIAREMMTSGDWVTIRYNRLKYFEKPPLQFWVTAAVYQVFGVGEWQARLWAATSGAAGLLVTMFAARCWFGSRVAISSGLVLLAAPAWNLGSHFNSLDMGVSGSLAAVLGAVLVAQHPENPVPLRRRWMWIAWAAAAAAVLGKGLIGLALPGLVLVVYTAVTRDLALWKRLELIRGSLIMLALAVPWFVLVSLRNPEFAHFFFIHEHWDRYTSQVHQRGAPVWYFIPQLAMGFLPWLGLGPRMVAVVRAEPRSRELRPLLLLAIWALTIFAFFSASGSKLPGDILPIYPALAVIAAVALDRIDARAWGWQVAFMGALAALVVVAAWATAASQPASGSGGLRSFAWGVVAASALALAGCALAWAVNRRGFAWRARVIYALTLFSATTVGMLAHEGVGYERSGAALVPVIEQALEPGMPIYSVRFLDHTLPFYLGRTTIMVEGADELAFGVEQEPQKWLPTRAAFEAAWASGRPALAIMSPQTHAELAAEHLVLFKVAEDARRVVVANFPGVRP